MSSTAVADVTVDCLCLCHSRVTVHPSMKKTIATKKIAAMIRPRSVDVIILAFPVNSIGIQLFIASCAYVQSL